MNSMCSAAVSVMQLAAFTVIPPSINVNGPDEVQLGYTVDFRMQGVDAKMVVGAKIALFPEKKAAYWSVLAEWGTGLPVMIFQSFVPGDYVIIVAYYDGEEVQMVQHNFEVIGEGPDPDPNPEPVKELFGVIVYESSDMLQERDGKQVNFGHILLSKDVHDEFEERHLRQVDKDALDEEGIIPEEYEPYLNAAKNKPLPYLFLVDERGRVLYDGPLPTSVVKTVETIRIYKQ